MATWVWKNEKGEVRRFLDLESGHIFSQTESVRDGLIYQIDTDFGWEADLTQLTEGNKNYSPAGYSYLYIMWDAYPNVINEFNENTKLIFKIVHGSYEDIPDKSKVSSSKDFGNSGTGIDFLWPVYDEKNNIQTLTMYLNNDYLGKETAIQIYTEYMLNYCTTTNPYQSVAIGTLGDISRKFIQ